MELGQMRAIIYTRCSTMKQRTDLQVEPLKELCTRSGYELIEIIEDIGVSGSKNGDKRKGMSKLLKMVNRREVDVVVVYSVDRIGRRLTDVINTAELFNQKGVGLVIWKNGIDTTTSNGKHLLSFFALIAEMELDFTRARIKDALAVRKQQGKQIGRSPISANLKNQIIKLRKDGMGMNKIAKTLSVGNSQVLRICKEIAA
jgi:DNA invertase Pin-like site-specific DNA recombinase